jgi:hypothetical protein
MTVTSGAQGSICFEMVKGLPAAFVALVIGAIAAGIAWRQYQVAKARLKLDLFDKRHPIYQQTWEILSEVVINGTTIFSRRLDSCLVRIFLTIWIQLRKIGPSFMAWRRKEQMSLESGRSIPLNGG